MKRLLLAASLLFASHAIGAQTFSWTASPGADGYNIYCAQTAGGYKNAAGAPSIAALLTVGKVLTTTATLPVGPNFCAATAFVNVPAQGATPAGQSQSVFSNEVFYTAPPVAPGNFKVTTITISLNKSTGEFDVVISQADAP